MVKVSGKIMTTHDHNESKTESLSRDLNAIFNPNRFMADDDRNQSSANAHEIKAQRRQGTAVSHERRAVPIDLILKINRG